MAVPVIAVPTSVGYGASFGGLAAMLTMLNSFASGVSVVNIDNGFAGGYIATLINRLGERPSPRRTRRKAEMMAKLQRVRMVPRLPRRAAEGHKGSYGHVLVVGGSRGMVGAVALAGNAALRGGAGLVTFAAPETVQLTIAGLCPCATSIPLACGANGELATGAVRSAIGGAHEANYSVLAVGPGLGKGGPTRSGPGGAGAGKTAGHRR